MRQTRMLWLCVHHITHITNIPHINTDYDYAIKHVWLFSALYSGHALNLLTQKLRMHLQQFYTL